MLPSHFYVSDRGELFDTRNDNWSHGEPLRSNYSLSHRKITSVADLKATLRAGAYAWPGGYPIALFMSDCGCMSFKTAREEFRELVSALRNYKTNKHERSGWRPIGADILWEGEEFDCHTDEPLETAYGPVESEIE